MSHEGRKPSSFYSSTNYLSPLERKRLRAIENEPQATEIKANQTSNKRSAKKSSPKRRDNAGKKTQPTGKRKRSASDSSKTAKSKPSLQQRSVSTRKASSAASEKKAVVIPLSDSKRAISVPAATSESSEPPAKKVRKFFSSGLRAPANAAVSSSMAVATCVSWNKKFKLKFEPAVAPLKKPSTTASFKSVKKELVMTVPFRPPKATAETVTSLKSVDVALPEPELIETPDKRTTYCIGPQKNVGKKTAKRELAMTVPFRRPQAGTVASTSRADLTVQQVPHKLPKETRGESVEMRQKERAGSMTDVPRKPPEETRAKSVMVMQDAEQAKITTESGHVRVSPLAAKTILEETGHEFSGVCEPCGKVDDDDVAVDEDRISLNKDDALSSATEHECSVVSLEAEGEQSNAVVTTPIRGSSTRSSTRSFMLQDRHGSANRSLPLRRLRTNVQDTADGRNFRERSLPPKALCTNIPDHASGTELSERPSTPPPDKTGSPNRQSLYPIFSTPTSNRKKIVELQKIPTSPIEMPRKRFILGSSDPAQLIIDAGQKKFGHTTCGTCGMVYTIGDVEDEKLHTQHHRSYLAVVKFPGWKNQREVGLYPDGKVIMVSPNDPKCMLNKMDEIRQMVDRELGILVDESAPRAPQMYFVFVSYTKSVLGFLSAQEIKQGYRVIPSDDGDMRNSYCSEREPMPAVCGVSRIWTAPFYRRKKVASRLLDRLRMNFSFGCPLDSRKIAFSDPTLMGRELAAAYTRNDRFLVFCP
ncbi:uncharacterized protein LOC119371735 [Rhipicephalus sanguineus]|uniref:N-acetyltransferase ESCO2 n=1 Tax=Rhipicephalus sanguineus TaxID=34632 RepID=A0A9D4QFI7_RHISA|nr:uncharacterized protein LOC119371735 [Rhipicephalus sanguineus]KAH7976623.1 hypothetical protein HPB52_017023 [Rhipicephalus sanguineus]